MLKFKDTMFKLMFPLKFQRILELERVQEELVDSNLAKDYEIKTLTSERKPSMADLMMEGLGLPMLDFVEHDSKGRPPHFYENLSPEARKNYVVSMSSIYNDRHFREAVAYCINLIANTSFIKDDRDAMHNAQMAALGIKTVLNEFKRADLEHKANNQREEEFDPHAQGPN